MSGTPCVLCGGCSLKELFAAREYITAARKQFRIVECGHCRLVRLDPMPPPEELAAYYPAEYFVVPEDEVRRRAPSFFIQDKVREVLRYKKSGVVLDIGCGGGGFIKRLQGLGFQVHGLDASPLACRLAGESVGAENIFHGDLMSVDFPASSYDVITMWHVIEHVHDPLAVLKKARLLLKDDGLLIVCCPNFDSWLRIFFKEKWYPFFVPHHLFHFTLRTLSIALEKAGYEVKSRKRHFVDPLTNMGSLKESLLRFMGLIHLTTMTPLDKKGEAVVPKRGFVWKAARFCFNAFCFAFSFFLSVLGNEELMLVWAAKKEGKR